MRARTLVVLAALCCFLSTGCATVMTGAGPNQTLRIASNPRGAKVYIDGDYKGVTPVGVAMTRSDNHHLRLEMDGYEPADRTIKTGYNPWHLGNIVFGGLIGASVDLLDGSFLWLGGNINQKLTRAADPFQAGTATATVASSQAGRNTRRAATAHRPPTARTAARPPARAATATSAPPRFARTGDPGPSDTRLPPRRLAAPPPGQ